VVMKEWVEGKQDSEQSKQVLNGFNIYLH